MTKGLGSSFVLYYDWTILSNFFLLSPLLFRILTATTLYSGQSASQSCSLLVIKLSSTSGKWNVVFKMSPFTSYQTVARISTFPLADITHTQSSSLIESAFASSGLIFK